MMSRLYLWLLPLLLVLAAAGLASGPPVRAQAEGTWTPAEILFDPRRGAAVTNYGANMVADPAGRVHLVWLHSSDEVGSIYYYSRWDGQVWSTPVDIFAGSPDRPLGWPEMVPTPDGRLYIFWASSSSVLYSWAWADAAGSAWAWSSPQIALYADYTLAHQIGVKLDGSGAFHLVCTRDQGDVYYARSDDTGASWTEPVAVTALTASREATEPRLDVAADGHVHVVWTEWPVPSEGATVRVSYAHSLDGGRTWSLPFEVGGYGQADPNVLALDDGLVYVVWNGGIAAGPDWGRNFRRSTDGGTTWEDPVAFSRQTGRAGYPSLALDSAGTLHILTADGEYVARRDGTFSAPQVLRPDPGIQTENSRMVIAHGNQLIAVLFPYDWVVYYTSYQLNVPLLPTGLPPTPHPSPSPAAGSAGTPPAGATVAPGSTAGPASTYATPSPDSTTGSAFRPVLLGVALSLLLVVVVVGWHAGRARSGR